MSEYYQSRKVIDSYCESVLNGKRIAGKHQKYAVQRYMEDIGSGYSRGIYFDEEAADYACNFFPTFCTHTIGAQFAGKPLTLEPWQAFCVWNLFGWRRQETSMRRFRRAYITVAAKAGKSTFAAGLSLLLAIADRPQESGAHVYICSTKLEQAKIVYDEVVKFVELNSELDGFYTIYRSPPPRIFFDSIHAKIGTIAVGGKLDGINAHGIIRDELHAFTEGHRDGCEKLSSRMLARQQPLMVDITTAGSDKSLLWREEDDYASRVAESAISEHIVDDSYFSFIARMDATDDPFAESSWHKANPSLGVTIPLSMIQEEANRAKQDATKLHEFLRYKCNVQVKSTLAAITPELWAKGSAPLSKGQWDEGYGGIDLARTRDLAAIGAAFPIRDESGKVTHWDVATRCWIARDGGTRIDREPFRSWIRDGKLSVIEGDRIIFDELEQEVVRWSQIYNVGRWYFDPYRAAELMTRLNANHGIAVEPFAQRTTTYNEPCTRFVDELAQGKIHHGNDPVLAWQAGNLEWYVDSGGLIKPDKGQRESKIDAMVSVLMGFHGCLFSEKMKWYYEDNELEIG